MNKTLLALSLAFLFQLNAHAWEQFQSPEEQTHLVELFSSEGCSSCPPADAWIAQLRSNPALWKSFVPIEFHVDYWNHLGWTDRFSKEAFTARQREYASHWGSDSVYTPGFVLDGQEWRPNSARELEPSLKKVGILAVNRIGPRRFKVSFSPKDRTNRNYVISGALLGNGLVSHIHSGENAGKNLTHEFVVLDLQSKSAQLTPQNNPSADFEFEERGNAAPLSRSVVFWVLLDGKTIPLQAAGGDISTRY